MRKLFQFDGVALPASLGLPAFFCILHPTAPLCTVYTLDAIANHNEPPGQKHPVRPGLVCRPLFCIMVYRIEKAFQAALEAAVPRAATRKIVTTMWQAGNQFSQ